MILVGARILRTYAIARKRKILPIFFSVVKLSNQIREKLPKTPFKGKEMEATSG